MTDRYNGIGDELPREPDHDRDAKRADDYRDICADLFRPLTVPVLRSNLGDSRKALLEAMQRRFEAVYCGKQVSQ